MIEQLIAQVFALRDATHLEHWTTKSGYHHTVLGDLYESLVDSLDSIVEAYRGNFTTFGRVPLKPNSAPVCDQLKELAAFLESERESLSGGVCGIENLIDNLSALCLSNLFKLEQLS